MKFVWKEVSPHTGKEIEEDAPANWAGGGNIHGIGVGPHGEPGIDPKKKKKKITLIDREGRLDGRTKAYREHRKKLEATKAARLKKQENKKSRFIEGIVNKIKEISYGPGFDTYKPIADLSANKKNPIAKQLSDPRYKPKTVKDKKKEKKKGHIKHKGGWDEGSKTNEKQY